MFEENMHYMKRPPFAFLFVLIGLSTLQSCAQRSTSAYLNDLPEVITEASEYNELTPEEARIILNKGTEWAYTGAFHDLKESGTYLCKQCNLPLFHSDTKFDSGTGWPSFDENIRGAVVQVLDKDGRRTEIVCSNCDGHLGHVFFGEGFTDKQTRHCVNSASLLFVPAESAADPE